MRSERKGDAMKIKLKDLKPNPFKKEINDGKLNIEKIDKLKESIEKCGFWDNVLCRKNGNGYELAYGHHRTAAAMDVLGRDHIVDIPCRDLSDEDMLRILANENSQQNEDYAIYQIDTVLTAKRWIAENRPRNGQSSKQSHKDEVGSREISDFLGEKNWSKSKVAELLKIQRDLHPDLLDKIKNAPNKGSENNEFNVSKARALARISDKKKQLEVYNIAEDQEMDSRGLEAFVNRTIDSDRKVAPVRVVNMQKVEEAIKNLDAREILMVSHELVRLIKKNKFDGYLENEKEALSTALGCVTIAVGQFLNRRIK